MKVKDVMTRELYYLKEDKELSVAHDVMKWHHVRHVPIVDAKHRLVGVLTQRDVLAQAVSQQAKLSDRERDELLSIVPVKSVMHPAVVTAFPETDLRAAAKSLVENKIGCLPVVEPDGKLVGILTESDFVRLIAHGDIPL